MLQPRKGSAKRKSTRIIKNANPNQVVALVRVSTDHQKNSVENQQTQLPRFAKSRGLELMGVFTDSNVSASSTGFLKRPAVKEMMKFIKKNNVKTILMERVDRSFRDATDYAITHKFLKDQGIFFRFMEPDIDLSTPTGEMIFSFLVQFAQMETQTRQQRQLSIVNMYREKRISRNGRAPYGWTTKPDPHKTTKSGKPLKMLVPDTFQQSILRMILDLRDNHDMSFPKILEILNESNIPSPMAGQKIKRYIKDANGEKTILFNLINCDTSWKIRGLISVFDHMDIDDQTIPKEIPPEFTISPEATIKDHTTLNHH